MSVHHHPSIPPTFLSLHTQEKIHWAVIPVEGIIAYLLLGIDEIAIQLEEPFGEWTLLKGGVWSTPSERTPQRKKRALRTGRTA